MRLQQLDYINETIIRKSIYRLIVSALENTYLVFFLMQYCHYVAGLVGIGLSRLFAASGLESNEVGGDQQLSNSMGLFLQKTNIIRDYLEDSHEGREFWPAEVSLVATMWKKNNQYDHTNIHLFSSRHGASLLMS